jgi:TRAP-type C4-dicarboxylate transport system substrate-binding protein
MLSLLTMFLFNSELFAKEPIKLVFTHWEPPSGIGGSTVIEFSKELEARTNNQVKVETALAATLGPTAEQFEMVAHGIADLGGFIPATTPGRFPLLSLVVEIPKRLPSSVPVTETYFELLKKGYFDKEMEPTKLLWFSCVSPIQILSSKKIASLQDVKGKKLRTSGEFWIAMSRKMGVTPVSLTVGDIYASLEKKVVDGAFLPYSTMDVFKLKEVTKYVTEIKLTYSAFAYAINKKVYNNLPEDIRLIIDELAAKYSKIESEKHDKWQDIGKESFLRMGDGREVIELNASDTIELEQIIKTISDEWIAKNEAKGLSPNQIMKDMNESLKKKLQ